ncbi:MAG: hypothetical protein ACPG1C_08580 [Alphaproteobacteria bacterium]
MLQNESIHAPFIEPRPSKSLTYVQLGDINPNPGPTIGYVCVLDVGTTGINPRFDHATNLAWMMLGVNAHYQVCEVLGPWSYDGPWPGDECASADGPINATIDGRTYGPTPGTANSPADNRALFLQHLRQCGLVVAHNAEFDEAMLRKALPQLPASDVLPWACSLRDIYWRGLGLFDHRLKDILEFGGMCHHAHNSVQDVIGLSWVLAQTVPGAAPISGAPEISILPRNVGGTLTTIPGIPTIYPSFLHQLVRWAEAAKVSFTLTGALTAHQIHSLKTRGYRKGGNRNQSNSAMSQPGWTKWVHEEAAAAEYQWLTGNGRPELVIDGCFARSLFKNTGTSANDEQPASSASAPIIPVPSGNRPH